MILRWPRELNALQLQKTHANRKSTSKSRKHFHQFDSRWCKCKFKALMFAFRTTSGSAPLYLNSLLQTYMPLEACVLQVNDALLYHPKEAQNHFHRPVSLTVPIWWNDLPNSIRAAESLPIFKKRLKHISSIFI